MTSKIMKSKKVKMLFYVIPAKAGILYFSDLIPARPD